MTEARRKCGDCTLCCTVMGITDLEPPKEPAVKCAHQCSRGCRIYATRPATCADFACVWLQGAFDKHMRPDKVGVVFIVDGEDPEQQRLVGFTDPARPNAWEAVAGVLESVGRKGVDVLVGPAGGLPQYRFTTTGRHKRPPGV